MLRKEWTRKAIAAGIALTFLALVQPEELPSLLISGALGIAFYEIALYALRVVQEERKSQRVRDLMARPAPIRWIDYRFRRDS